VAWTEQELDDALEIAFDPSPTPLLVAARKLDAATFSDVTAAQLIASAGRLVVAGGVEEMQVAARRPPVTNENYWMLRMYRRIGG